MGRDSAPATISLAAEVVDALAQSRGLVGLESVAFAHGFEGDAGVQHALTCMGRVRDAGSVPAVVFVDRGTVRLEVAQDQVVAFFHQRDIRKLGTRDIADAVLRGQSGALTIGATAAICDRVGIRVMSSGGLGGVHMGFAQSLDVSSDLNQVAAADVIVVSAGIKPVLDVAATIEVLETLGVPTLGWCTNEVPIFYKSISGHRVSTRVESVDEVADMALLHWSLGLGGGVLLMRPPSHEVDIDDALEAGLKEAEAQRVRGQDVTPFLLAWLDSHTLGETVEPHGELLCENANLAGQVASCFGS